MVTGFSSLGGGKWDDLFDLFKSFVRFLQFFLCVFSLISLSFVLSLSFAELENEIIIKRYKSYFRARTHLILQIRDPIIQQPVLVDVLLLLVLHLPYSDGQVPDLLLGR